MTFYKEEDQYRDCRHDDDADGDVDIALHDYLKTVPHFEESTTEHIFPLHAPFPTSEQSDFPPGLHASTLLLAIQP